MDEKTALDVIIVACRCFTCDFEQRVAPPLPDDAGICVLLLGVYNPPLEGMDIDTNLLSTRPLPLFLSPLRIVVNEGEVEKSEVVS